MKSLDRPQDPDRRYARVALITIGQIVRAVLFVGIVMFALSEDVGAQGLVLLLALAIVVGFLPLARTEIPALFSSTDDERSG